MKIAGRRTSKNFKDSGRVEHPQVEKPRGMITSGELGKLRYSSKRFEDKEFKRMAKESLLKKGRSRRSDIEQGYKAKVDPKDPYAPLKMKPYAEVRKAVKKKYGEK